MSSVVLIHPPLNFGETDDPLSGYSPPLGLLYLGRKLRDKGHEVNLIDAEAEGLSKRQIIKRVELYNPDVVGLTCLTYTLKSCKELIRGIKKTIDPYIVVGGPHITTSPQEYFEDLGADLYVRGEAESIINKIIEDKPRGTIFAKEIQDIDSIPFPDRSLVEDVKYGRFYGLMGTKMTGILTTRGCKYGCTYCNRPKKLRFRARSPKNIVEELKEIEKQGFKSVWLADDNFTNNPENVIKLARLIKREKLKFTFFGQARVDVPSRALYKSMKEMGILGLSFGVESLNPEIIRWYNKTQHPEKWPGYVKKTLDLCDEYDILFLGSLIFGAPIETKKDMEHSIEFLEKNKADFINGNILLYLVGSPIWNWARKEGKIKPEQYMATAPELGLTPYSHEELTEMCNCCTDISKNTTHWIKKIIPKLWRCSPKIVLRGAIEYIIHNPKVRKMRKKIYGYGYGKERNKI
jgi:radical SAM superfamily enzyme YgiQ (UPF0313 family)